MSDRVCISASDLLVRVRLIVISGRVWAGESGFRVGWAAADVFNLDNGRRSNWCGHGEDLCSDCERGRYEIR